MMNKDERKNTMAEIQVVLTLEGKLIGKPEAKKVVSRSWFSEATDGFNANSPRDHRGYSHAEDGEHNRGCTGSFGYGPGSHNPD